jgi:DNA polymerase-1
MKIRTLLVDSSYLLQRSFHGAKDTYTNKFGHIGGLYAFMTTVRKLIREHMVNKVVLIWDGEGGGIERYHIDKEYKANRKNKEWHKKIEMTTAEIRRERNKEMSLLKQKVRIQEYAEELYFRQIEVTGVEADDIIAAYCLQYNNKEEIFLYSGDRDFAQLLDLNITIIFPNIDQPVNKINYIMHFNHYYANALIMKIICGDTSDNVQGINGMGEKTLLEYFPELAYKHLTVREICQKADEINKQRIFEKKKPLKVFENLLHNVERLKINYQLVNLRQPLLTDKAINELEQLEMPLLEFDENGKNKRGEKLYDMMVKEDEFLSVYGSTYPSYIEPFYTVIMNEKQLLTEYNKKISHTL